MAIFEHNYKAWRVLPPLLFLDSCMHKYTNNALGAPQVPCYYIFGDSMSANGNNNLLMTMAKSNYPPYGVDFPEVPTGRFTNGRTIVDVITEHLGFDAYIASFATAKGEENLRGVNYASGAAGIRDETGDQLGDRIPFNLQLWNHFINIRRVKEMLGANASAYLNECIYTVELGANDYINNYFVPDAYPTSRLYTSEQYAIVLGQQYAQQLKTLYSYGARKVAIIGVGPIGCTPIEISRFGADGSPTRCVDKVNSAAELFDDRLRTLVVDLNSNLANAKFTFINTMKILSSANAPHLNRHSTCCQVDVFRGQCVPDRTPCANRSLYEFYDGVHSTEIVNLQFGARAYRASLSDDAYPHDIHHLAML